MPLRLASRRQSLRASEGGRLDSLEAVVLVSGPAAGGFCLVKPDPGPGRERQTLQRAGSAGISALK